MVGPRSRRQGSGSGPRRRVWASKAELLAGGDLASALTYERASKDKKKQGKSVGDQHKLNLAEVTRYGWRHGESFSDNDVSASRHAKTKKRQGFEDLMDRIRSGTDDVLVVWEISRKERDLAVYVMIRDLCSEVGLNFWLVGGQLFDLRDRNDRMMLGFQAVQAEFQSDYIRDNVQRGVDGAAASGRPHGKLTYGYERIYHSRTKALVEQRADEEVHTATGADGTVTEYTKAGVVREIFEKVGEGVPLIRIEESLNERGIPAAQGGLWRRGIVRKIALNIAYIGKRSHHGEITEGIWEGLVSEDTYWSVRNMLENPDRTTWKPARARYLLSYMVKCGKCDGPLSVGNVNRHGWSGQVYSCLYKRCAAVKMQYLDEYVERIVVAWLARPETFENLHRVYDGSVAAQARGLAEKLKSELEEWRVEADLGNVTAVSFGRAEMSLLRRIAEAEAKAREAGIPPVLRGMIGPNAEADWAALGGDVARKREIIKEILEIKLMPAGKGTRKFSGDRVAKRWLLLDDNAQVPA